MSDITGLIRAAAAHYNLDPEIFRRQLVAESGLNPNARNSHSGAAGIAQFMPGTAAGLGIDPMDPSQAIPAAAGYMRQNLNRFGDSYEHALAAYNWGPGNVERHGLDNMPGETRNYIAKVMGGGPLMAPASGTGDGTAAAPPAPGLPMAPPAGPPQPAAQLPMMLPQDPVGSSLADAFMSAAKRVQGTA